MSCTFKSSELASCEDLGLWQGQGWGGSERRLRYLASSNANNRGAKPSKICSVSLVAVLAISFFSVKSCVGLSSEQATSNCGHSCSRADTGSHYSSSLFLVISILLSVASLWMEWNQSRSMSFLLVEFENLTLHFEHLQSKVFPNSHSLLSQLCIIFYCIKPSPLATTEATTVVLRIGKSQLMTNK